ncbi:hypothetical protein PR003_g18079 [Phytophthora rubi]|uniref:Uncharacterized protein n=1 Tax=Phytophthora rubi TaxID=129364 RepID=A0A6A4EA86_9STRA|nr:hypothetical protein PR002_g17653 [Phytophthora rubi]KAE9319058.1 hypothetical protein PR003_g18079 [Phytophthora rubi]
MAADDREDLQAQAQLRMCGGDSSLMWTPVVVVAVTDEMPAMRRPRA